MENNSFRIKKRGIFLLPNLFTTAGLFAGFFSIISSINDNFIFAAAAIFIAAAMDTIDGRIARITNTQSKFGAEYDSLADMISFGLAPAIISFQWALFDLKKAGWIAAFIYVAAVALRLARFNTQVGIADKRYFQGLPSPAGAGLIAGLVWAGMEIEIRGVNLNWLMFTLTIFTGVLMVSNIRYSSFKEVNFKDKVPFFTVLIITLGYAVIASYPPVVLFMLFLIYVFSGPAVTLYQINRRRKLKKTKKQV